MLKNILIVISMTMCSINTYEINSMPTFFQSTTPIDSTEETKQYTSGYIRMNNEQECTLDGLAGTHPMSICFLIHQLTHSNSDPECCFNALLLYGPPGTGKTTMANSIARSAKATILKYSAATMVTDMQGSGTHSIKKMFKKVTKALDRGEKIVLFVDEIDAFTRDRNKRANEDQVNALLEFIVKHKDNPKLIIIVTSNKKELLDPAFLSRFKLVEVKLPNRAMCEQILKHHLDKYKYDQTINIQEFATRLHKLEMSGRDIEKIVNEARQKSKMSGAPLILIPAMEDVIQEMVKQKKKMLEEESKKKYQEKRAEEMTELDYRTKKREYDEQLKNRIRKQNAKGEDDSESE
ncbi:MAG TPA: AAA family ATPase [Candidatus Babeliales bacterium]|nr:AAA family ATPase [Candidatus Babeliales bacterium]